MNFNQIKKRTNEILKNRNCECSYIEYKKSELQLDKILKTICAYGNNLYQNEEQYIFVGIEEENSDVKAVPKLPISGIDDGRLEIVINKIKSLTLFIYPNVKFDVIPNKFENRDYVVIVVPRQVGGPFEITEKAEKDKTINLRPGRYIRSDFESRIARVSEEYELIRKFANYYFDVDINEHASFDDLNYDYMKEYVQLTSNRNINENLSKKEISDILNLTQKTNPNYSDIYNYAVLMFSDRPDKFIKNAYIELISDMYGSRKMMESKNFKGPIWKQYLNVVKYIKNNFITSITTRISQKALSDKIENFPFTAIEELVANAIVHNNYENNKCIQIYISEKEINIVNYNLPLPPVSINDLNEKTTFNERNAINPTIRNMFKELHIIESFGTGVGEAKLAMEKNGSPSLYYKKFMDESPITSVVIPVNEEYYKIKMNAKKINNNGDVSSQIHSVIINSEYTNQIKNNLIKIYDEIKDDIISNNAVRNILKCGETTATKYIKIMVSLSIVISIDGLGKNRFKFKNQW